MLQGLRNPPILISGRPGWIQCNQIDLLSQHNASPVHTAALQCPRFFKAPSDAAAQNVAAEVPTPKHPTILSGPSSPTQAANGTPSVTELALNCRTGKYECYPCHRRFGALFSLKAHLASPAHDTKEVKCPHYSCGRQFPGISALTQHIKKDGCGRAKVITTDNDRRSARLNVGKTFKML